MLLQKLSEPIIWYESTLQYLDIAWPVFSYFTFFSALAHCAMESYPKGQLISKCPFGRKTSSKKPTKLFLDFCSEVTYSFQAWISALKLFIAFRGLPGSFGDIVSNIIHKEAYRKPPKASRKPQGSYKKFQGRNPEIISLVFWKKFSDQKDILKLTDL